MERFDNEEGAILKEDGSLDNGDDGDFEFVEVDPTGRYERYAEVLGRGAYKTVYRAFDNLDGIEVAWNEVKVQDMLGKDGDVERLYSELHLLKMLKHKNIMKLCSSWVDTRHKNVNFITEIFTSGTLRQYRKKHRNVKLKAIKNWARQILHGLVYLHNHHPPIIHRDLKCDNIFINGNSGEVKIGDLGLAAILSQAPAAHSVIGTPEFMAPELYEEHYNELVDIYSFGMCLLEMLTLEYPYSECMNAAQIYKKVTAGKKPAAIDKVKDPEVRMFIEKCLASAQERLHARELLLDPFLRSDDIVEMFERVQPTIPNLYDDVAGLYPIYRQSHIGTFSAEPPDDNGQCELAEDRRVARLNDISSDKLQGSNLSQSKVSCKERRDFKLKARKQNDKKVLVRFCMTNSTGELRYIQFEFDLETDTPMSLANEMITELELSAQDASVIADMIDAELMSLILDWKPGLHLHEAGVNVPVDVEQESVLTNAQVQEKKADELDGSDATVEPPTDFDDSRNDILINLMHGRFEEVGSNQAGWQHKQQELDGLGCFSGFSSEQCEGGGSDLSLDASFDCLSVETGPDDQSATQNMEFGPDIKLEPLFALEKPSLLPPGGNLSEQCLPFPDPEPKLKVDSGLQEVKLLVLQQNQELQLLQSKHHQELYKMCLHEHAKTALTKLRLKEGVSLEAESAMLSSSVKTFSEHEAVPKICKENALDLHAITKPDEISVDVVVQNAVVNHSQKNSDKGGDTQCSESDITLDKPEPELELAIDEPAKSKVDLSNYRMRGLGKAECHIKSTMGTVMAKAAESMAYLSSDPATRGSDKAKRHVKSASMGAVIADAMETTAYISFDRTIRPKTSLFPRSMVNDDGIESKALPRSAGLQRASSFNNKRESYLGLYKTGRVQIDRAFGSKLLEKPSISDKCLKAFDPRNGEVEQARKQQLQKSIAELEAKTLEGLSRSQSRYLSKVAGKSNANTQPSSIASHGR